MRDEEIERLLRAMPLRTPRNLPSDLPQARGGDGRLTSAVRAALSFKVPLWQVAAALIAGIVLWSSLAPTPPAPAADAPPRAESPEAAPLVTPPEGEAVQRMTASAEKFWTLPERYRRMIDAARKHHSMKTPFERNGS